MLNLRLTTSKKNITIELNGLKTVLHCDGNFFTDVSLDGKIKPQLHKMIHIYYNIIIK